MAPKSPSTTCTVTNPQPSSTTNEESPCDYDVDDWIAAVYDNNWYIGKVIEFDDDEDNEVHIDFMAKCSGPFTEAKYKWPVKKDAIWIARSKVLCNIVPCFCDNSKRMITLSAEQKKLIEEAFNASASRN